MEKLEQMAKLATELDNIGQVEAAKMLDQFIAEAAEAQTYQPMDMVPSMDEQLSEQAAQARKLERQEAGGGRLRQIQLGTASAGAMITELDQTLKLLHNKGIETLKTLGAMERNPDLTPQNTTEQEAFARFKATKQALTNFLRHIANFGV